VSPRKARRLPLEVPRRRRPGPPRQQDRHQAGQDGQVQPRLGPPRTETWPDGDWVVRHIPGAAAVKRYRCPGCDQEIAAGTPHVVAWPSHAPDADERRHWHASCWRRRPRRPGPGFPARP